MRRLPGPAHSRLSEGSYTPEALSELFRDWQRTQTQSSVRALWSLRQQMDVRLCKSRNHQPRGTVALRAILIRLIERSPERAQDNSCFFLDRDLHGCRLYVQALRRRLIQARYRVCR
jgi:hypothetical protein